MQEEPTFKFSIGISISDGVDTFLDYVRIFKPWINDVFYSPPIGDKFHDRLSISPLVNVDNLHYIADELKKMGVKRNLCLNTPMLNDSDCIGGLEIMEGCYEEVTTLQKYLEPVRSITDVPLCYSFNNGLNTPSKNANISSEFSTVVVGQYLRNLRGIRDLRHRGFEPKIMLQNGCFPHCTTDCRKCYDFRKLAEQRYTMEESYAIHSIMPWEFHTYYLPEFTLFKLATREMPMKSMIDTTLSYIHNINRAYILGSKDKYRLWARMTWFKDYINSFDYDTIMTIKHTLWEESLSRGDSV